MGKSDLGKSDSSGCDRTPVCRAGTRTLSKLLGESDIGKSDLSKSDVRNSLNSLELCHPILNSAAVIG